MYWIGTTNGSFFFDKQLMVVKNNVCLVQWGEGKEILKYFVQWREGFNEMSM
jgi:hypothetical protein